jgi:hypothetical protein
MCQPVVSFTVDTGAQVNIIDEKTYNKLKLKPKLHKCSESLFSYNSSKPIETLGQFETRILLNKMYHKVEFIVAKGCAGNLMFSFIKSLPSDLRKMAEYNSEIE